MTKNQYNRQTEYKVPSYIQPQRGERKVRERSIKKKKQPPRRLQANMEEVFCEKGVRRNFAKFTGKQLYQSHFFDKF